MAVSNTEKIGFANQFIQLMQDNSTLLKGSGLDVKDWITEITGQRDNAVVEGGKQDERQAAAKAQTKISGDAHKLLYSNSSTKLDAVTGVLGKGTPAAKQAAKLRSSINKSARKPKPSDPQ